MARVPTLAYAVIARHSGLGACSAAHVIGQYTCGIWRTSWPDKDTMSIGSDSHQHAGPKLSGYPTSTTTSATVIQNPAVGFLRSVTFQSPRSSSASLQFVRLEATALLRRTFQAHHIPQGTS